MKNLLLVICIPFAFLFEAVAQTVPEQVAICGMEITLDEKARDQIREYMSQIFQSPIHFNKMVQRADMYMPFIEEAFEDVDIPLDLKFLAIQESGLRASVISTSNAVGFWQFKEGSGKEMGLMINGEIDERMHIYRASVAAAKYFQLAYKNFNNWIYAILGFKEGMTGALPHVEEGYFNSDRMKIDGDFHWYVLKFIAHKLAYEEALQLNVKPEQWLVPFSSGGMKSIKRLHQGHGINQERFLNYNQWILTPERLPSGNSFTYYIFRSGSFYPGHKEDPCKNPALNPEPVVMTSLEDLREASIHDKAPPSSTEPTLTNQYREVEELSDSLILNQDNTQSAVAYESDAASSGREAKSSLELPANSYVEFNIYNDLQYGEEYIYYDGSKSIYEVARAYEIEVNDFLNWNRLSPRHLPLSQPQLLYLKEAQFANYHIVKSGENLVQIAALHKTSARVLQKKNGMLKDDFDVYLGQKIYLGKKKPKREKIILLTFPNQDNTSEQEEMASLNEDNVLTPVEEDSLSSNAGKDNINEPLIAKEIEIARSTSSASEQLNSADQSKWILHEVVSGEKIDDIANKYGVSASVIKMINKIEGDNITDGQVLRIFVSDIE